MPTFKQTVKAIIADLPSSKFTIKAFVVSYFYSPRFRILLNHRLGKFFFKSNSFLLRQLGTIYKVKLITNRGCDISYNAELGKNIRMPHPIGIVVGDGVVIKDNVMIFQQVTFGSHGKNGQNKSYPIIENNVTIYAGAKILGGITIGENATIGANAVVNINVPPNSVAVGIPCKILDNRE